MKKNARYDDRGDVLRIRAEERGLQNSHARATISPTINYRCQTSLHLRTRRMQNSSVAGCVQVAVVRVKANVLVPDLAKKNVVLRTMQTHVRMLLTCCRSFLSCIQAAEKNTGTMTLLLQESSSKCDTPSPSSLKRTTKQ
jgi:hypothetical protein